MGVKVAYQLDGDGFYVGKTLADESPLEPGVYHYPAGTVEKKPPTILDGHSAKWHNGDWMIVANEVPDPPKEAPPLTYDQVAQLRKITYRQESDHLKIEAEHDAIVSGGEPDYSQWLAKVAEIKEKYPLP